VIVRLLILAIMATGVLAGWKAWELARMPAATLPAATGTVESESTAAGPEALTRAQRSQIEHLVARPPFAETRRPPEAEASDTGIADGSAAPDQPLDARLLGVIDDGGERFAVLVIGGGQSTRILRRGGEVEGWRVEIIDDKRVILRKGSEEAEILLFKEK